MFKSRSVRFDAFNIRLKMNFFIIFLINNIDLRQKFLLLVGKNMNIWSTMILHISSNIFEVQNIFKIDLIIVLEQ